MGQPARSIDGLRVGASWLRPATESPPQTPKSRMGELVLACPAEERFSVVLLNPLLYHRVMVISSPHKCQESYPTRHRA